MKKAALEFLVLVVCFAFVLFLLRLADWNSLLHVNEAKQSIEKNLGKVITAAIESSGDECDEKSAAYKGVVRLCGRICEANRIDSTSIKIHVVKSEIVNAMALPDRHLVVYTRLIRDCVNESELAGVLAHEIAHMERRHVMKKLAKELGIATLLGMGNDKMSGAGAKQVMKTLGSTAYDRELEEEADREAFDYLLEAKINPEGLANFFYRIANDADAATSILSFVSTHPQPEERAKEIVDKLKDEKISWKEVLSSEEWEQIKTELKHGED